MPSLLWACDLSGHLFIEHLPRCQACGKGRIDLAPGEQWLGVADSDAAAQMMETGNVRGPMTGEQRGPLTQTERNTITQQLDYAKSQVNGLREELAMALTHAQAVEEERDLLRDDKRALQEVVADQAAEVRRLRREITDGKA